MLPPSDEQSAHPPAGPPESIQHSAATSVTPEATAVASDFSAVPTQSALFFTQPVIQGYRVVREISRGGQGVVYEAVPTAPQDSPDPPSEQRVAIKMLKVGSQATETERKRFAREIRVLSTLSHPNVVRVLGSGETTDGSPYAIMEFVDGRPLHDFIQERRLDLPAVVRLLIDICKGLAAAHSVGIVHRDVKPSNILVRGSGTPCLLDFGLAKRLDTIEGRVTSTDDVLGTLPYMSPEQATGSANLDQRSDVYSFGVVLYRILSGRYPYPVGNNLADVVQHIVDTPPATFQLQAPFQDDTGKLERQLETVILRALAKAPRARYDSARDIAEDLQRCLQGKPVRARRTRITHVLLDRGRAFVRRQRWASAGACALAVATVMWAVDRYAFDTFTGFNNRYRAGLMSLVQRLSPTQRMKSVSIINAPDRDSLERVTASLGITEYRAQDPLSYRLVLARLLPKLVEAGCRAIALTSALDRPSSYDDALAEAVRHANVHNIHVTAPLRSWADAEAGIRRLSPGLNGVVNGAPSTGYTSGPTAWTYHLFVERASGPTFASQALVTLTAARHPDWSNSIRIAVDEEPALLLSYWRAETDGGKAWSDQFDKVRYSADQLLDMDDPGRGLRKTDRVALFQISTADMRTVELSSVPIDRALSLPAEALRREIAGRVAVIGHPVSAPALRSSEGGAVHAEVVTALVLDSLFAAMESRGGIAGFSRTAALLLAASLGALLALGFENRPARRWTALIVGAIVALLLSFALAWWPRLIWVPIAAIASLILAAALLVRLRRSSAPAWEQA